MHFRFKEHTIWTSYICLPVVHTLKFQEAELNEFLTSEVIAKCKKLMKSENITGNIIMPNRYVQNSVFCVSFYSLSNYLRLWWISPGVLNIGFWSSDSWAFLSVVTWLHLAHSASSLHLWPVAVSPGFMTAFYNAGIFVKTGPQWAICLLYNYGAFLIIMTVTLQPQCSLDYCCKKYGSVTSPVLQLL